MTSLRGLNPVICTPKNDNQKLYVRHITTKNVTFGLGPAGTGKTLLAIDYACVAKYESIILTRPIIEAGGEELGFLPGKLSEKIGPYFRPIEDYWRGSTKNVKKLPLAHMRGVTFTNTLLILDEAQNCTFRQLKLLLTRFGEGSKYIINGDPSQSDITNSGLNKCVDRLNDMAEVGIVRFTTDDVLRSNFVKKILQRMG